VRREHDGRALGHLRECVDEHCASCPKILDNVRVVDDLLADVDGISIERKSALDRLDRPFDSRAVASRGGEEKAFHHCRATIAGKR
jgi:hypothetical protein